MRHERKDVSEVAQGRLALGRKILKGGLCRQAAAAVKVGVGYSRLRNNHWELVGGCRQGSAATCTPLAGGGPSFIRKGAPLGPGTQHLEGCTWSR